jgi:hypothetical protein
MIRLHECDCDLARGKRLLDFYTAEDVRKFREALAHIASTTTDDMAARTAREALDA